MSMQTSETARADVSARALMPAGLLPRPTLLVEGALAALQPMLHSEDEDSRGAAQARDDILAQVAHDLRGPLNVIALCSESLEGSAVCQQSTASIRRAAARMGHLIDDLLINARLDAGQAIPLERTLVHPAGLLETAVDEHRWRARERGVALQARWTAMLPLIWLDAAKIQRILDNLLDNAIKFTARGGWVIASVAPGTGQLSFTVSDSGRGIASNDLPHIFEPRWQKRRDARGLGLGLGIAKNLAEAHDGMLQVASVIGRGTTFTLTLPTVPRPPLVSNLQES